MQISDDRSGACIEVKLGLAVKGVSFRLLRGVELAGLLVEVLFVERAPGWDGRNRRLE